MTRFCQFLLVMGALGTAAEQRLGDAVCRLESDRSEVALSGELRITLSIEGSAPVEVESPRPLSSSPDWRVRAGQPKTVALSGGRERWEQSFQLAPYQAGHVTLPLEPVQFRTQNELRDRSVSWPPLEIRVTSEVSEADLSKARGVTGIDELPPLPSSQFLWPYLAVTGIIGLVGLTTAALLLRRRAHKPMRSPRDQAIDELLRLEAEGDNAVDLAQRLADLVRRYLEGRYDLAATRLTTAEFLGAMREKKILTREQLQSVGELLQRGDLAKFAGLPPSPEECITLLAAARRLIAEATPASQV
jgi:hypothetical protein